MIYVEQLEVGKCYVVLFPSLMSIKVGIARVDAIELHDDFVEIGGSLKIITRAIDFFDGGYYIHGDDGFTPKFHTLIHKPFRAWELTEDEIFNNMIMEAL